MSAIDRLIHRWRFDFLPPGVANAETGSMDNYCRCWWCRKVMRRWLP